MEQNRQAYVNRYDLYYEAFDKVKNALEKLIEVEREAKIDLTNIDLDSYFITKGKSDPDLINNNNFPADLVIFTRESIDLPEEATVLH